ncbi:hypothetical protein, partial [Amycolatopsis sp.]|uniref:hypothetical protein n=1 Tax=Amycolatopsis sp. TaxID=37632 RepID=UPI002B490DF0
MRGLLDDQTLDGAHEVQLTYRPERVGIPLFKSRETSISSIVRYICQIWGGAINPILPVEEDGSLNRDYASVLTGAAVDRISGASAFHLFHLRSIKLKPAEQQQSAHGYQLAVALLQPGQQDKYQTLESVALEDEDPWRDIYAACLGLLPEIPDREILKAGYLVPELTFENYLRVQRPTVSGSLDDLLERLHCDDVMTPRMLSMIHLSYGNAGSTGIRSE